MGPSNGKDDFVALVAVQHGPNRQTSPERFSFANGKNHPYQAADCIPIGSRALATRE